jgi:hypothetical protein
MAKGFLSPLDVIVPQLLASGAAIAKFPHIDVIDPGCFDFLPVDSYSRDAETVGRGPGWSENSALRRIRSCKMPSYHQRHT